MFVFMLWVHSGSAYMEFSIGVSSRFVCFFNVGNSCALAPFSRYSQSYIPIDISGTYSKAVLQ